MASLNTTTPQIPLQNTRCHIAKPPQPPVIRGKSVFLSGSIEQGAAVDWQTRITTSLSHLPITILNPRRAEWDSSWVEDISCAPFREQVEWELDALDAADVIAIYFDKDTKAPVTLMELGLHAKRANVVVCCPQGYWKRGNVQIVCARFGIEVVETLEELVQGVIGKLVDLGVREDEEVV
jgi:hypothetical protein